MTPNLTIGRVSRLTGIPSKTIRFYEAEGLLAAPARTDAGYRLYGQPDVTRLQLIRGARLLGVDLPRIKDLLDKALGETCGEFGEDIQAMLSDQLADVERRLSELTALRDELQRLQGHVAHCCEGCPPGQLAAECNFCDFLIQPEGGDSDA
jgi:DNA-binding transcriptional MerR regulator